MWSSQVALEGRNHGGDLANQHDGAIPTTDYVNNFKTLYPTEIERQTELERVCAERAPGFAYATLAMLATDSRYRTAVNLIVTTNFDDLIGDAFHLYTDIRPRIFSHEMVSTATINNDRPTIIKLHSDQHLELADEWRRNACASEQTRVWLGHLLDRRDVIIIGHSGNDISICDALQVTDNPHDPSKIYWVNDKEPGSAMSSWLNERTYIPVDHLDFDHMMLLIHRIFNLSHPSTRRAESTVDKYAVSLLAATQPFARSKENDNNLDLYGALETARSNTEYRDVLDIMHEFQAAEWNRQDSDKENEYQKHPTIPGLFGLIEHAKAMVGGNDAMREAKTKDRYDHGILQFPDDAQLLFNYGQYLSGSTDDKSQLAQAQLQLDTCLKIDPTHTKARNLLDQVKKHLAPSTRNKPSWTASASDDIALLVSCLPAKSSELWKNALPGGHTALLDELVIETPEGNWHTTEPPDSSLWTTMDRRIGEQVDALAQTRSARVHVFAHSPYSLGILLGNRLAQRIGRGRKLMFYQYSPGAGAWEHWGPNPTPTASSRNDGANFLRQDVASNRPSSAQHVVLAVHISRELSKPEIEKAMASAGSTGDHAWINVRPTDGIGPGSILDAAANDQCVAELDEILFKTATDHPEAKIHVFYAGPLATLMSVGAKVHLLSARATLYERIQVGGTPVFMPAVDLQTMSLLLGIAPAPKPSGAQPKHATAKRLTSERLRFLVVASEWSSVHGGLSTFNRLLCGALATAGHDVSCLVPAATEGEGINAAEQDVKLICATRPAVSEEGRLLLKPTLKLPPDVVVGHGRVTGEAAHVQSREHFPGSTLVHFVHTSPEHIEWFKGDTVAGDASHKADARQDNEIRMCKQADLAVGVGPRLTDHIKNKILSGDGYVMPIHRLDPGLTDIRPVNRQPTRPHCILLARAEDRRLKGIDIALRALDGCNPKYSSFLMIRGVPEGQTEEFWGWARSLARNVDVRPFAYSADEDKVAANIRESSLVLMPSREEGFGLVGLEAISAGVPVLISGNSGLGEMLSDQRSHSATRAVVEMSGNDDTDIETWRVKIGNILHNREAAYEDARTLRGELASVLNWDTAVEKLVAALREASKGNPTSDAS